MFAYYCLLESEEFRLLEISIYVVFFFYGSNTLPAERIYALLAIYRWASYIYCCVNSSFSPQILLG